MAMMQGGRQVYDFNPRSPHGERRQPIRPSPSQKNFNPRSPHGERQYSQSIQQ